MVDRAALLSFDLGYQLACLLRYVLSTAQHSIAQLDSTQLSSELTYMYIYIFVGKPHSSYYIYKVYRYYSSLSILYSIMVYIIVSL